MQVTAAVLRELGASFEVCSLDLEEPREDEMLVRLVATGICHTDLSVAQRPSTPLPIVLGHEGSGVVEQVGAAVSGFAPGDRVVLSFDACQVCPACLRGRPAYCRQARPLNFGGRRADGSTAFSRDGQPVYGHFFGQSSFSSHVIARARNAVKVDDDLPLELLGTLGCGVQTGAGAVLNALRPQAGSAIAVFGCGSVGLSALLAALISGCTTIIAVDVRDNRLEAALQLGATHAVRANRGDVAAELRSITGNGVDYAFSSTGDPATLRQAVESLDMLGVCGFVAGGGDAVVPTSTLVWGRSLRGIIQGDSVPKLFIPRLIDLWREGRFPFDRLVSYFDFAAINEAAQASLDGRVIKPVLRF